MTARRTRRPARARECALVRALLLGALTCAHRDVRAAESAADIAARARRVVSDERFQTEHPPFRAHDQKLRDVTLGGDEDSSAPSVDDPRRSPERRRDSLTPGDDPQGERASTAERARLAREARRARDARRARRLAEAEHRSMPPALPRSEVASVASQLVSTLLLVLLGAVVLGGIALLIAGHLARRSPSVAQVNAAGQRRADSDAPLPEEGDIERLAREGHHAEAIHLMLQRAVAHLARQGRLALSDDMTAREALRAVVSGDAARRPLGELVLAVEISLFGGRDLDHQDYDRCATAFRALLGSPASAAAAQGTASP
ncbi:DUF4129 domain-containing protein [Chondromyces apiculatus]|uniref:Uncharacterized protein n=1 Tax=Chondromyces apiculatus DSM 436 TaxID=1192034 RepID=A0A017T7R5_9BACT|nr:DUF4129 domain-containing protein [Chondromyces apiculatus]EYF04611.1 Hypothetical protein CAP_4287 [Chondromyces apiculatus DSM 436]